jgi:pimeloyl-ACP methyl ester carboxylesterase
MWAVGSVWLMRVDIGGLRLFFDVEGAGLAGDGPRMRHKPTLLMLHGGPGFDHTFFKPWFSRFADTHQVVYLDHRGQGRSDERDDPTHWDLDTWANDVVLFCKALDIDSPVLFGNSFGGMVAASVAGQHPRLASKVVLSSTAARIDIPAIAEMMRRLGGETASELAVRFWTDPTPEAQEAYLETCMPLYTRHSHSLTEGRERAAMNLAVTSHFINGEQRTMDLRPQLSAIVCPTLVLAGQDDPVCPPSAQDEIVAALSGCPSRYELLADCGHGTYRDQPDATETILRDFLAET